MGNRTPQAADYRKTRAVYGEVDPHHPTPLLPEESPSPWVSTSGTVAHPESPNGAGGPGNFRSAGPVGGPGNRAITLNHPSTLSGRAQLLKGEDYHRLANSTGVPLKTNKAPVTVTKNQQITKTIKKTIGQHTVSTKIDVTISILEDIDSDASVAEGTAATKMDPDQVAPEFPDIEFDNDTGKITKEDGMVTFQGTMTIRTHYRDVADKNKKSGYGRGTTKADVTNGDITVGFHEKCHRDDWWAYLTTTDFPAFTGHVGMSKEDYKKAQDKLDQDWEDYIQAGHQQTYNLTDDVGDPTEAQHKANK